MKIKKFLSGVLAVILACMFAACAAPPKIVSNNKNYFREWHALDSDVLHDELAYTDDNGNYTGGQKVDGLWQTYWIITHQKSTVSCRVDNVGLQSGYFRFTANFLINEINVNSYGENYDTIAELRVYDNDTDELLAFKEINRYEVTAPNAILPYSVTFTNDKPRNVKLYLTTRGNTLMRAETLQLKAITAAEHIVPDYYPILQSGEEEKNATFNEDTLYFFDLYKYLRYFSDSTVQYDLSTIVFALQGFANREAQRLYVNFTAPSWLHNGIDTYWLEEMQKSGGELEGKTITQLHSFEALLKVFSGFYNGLAVWDENVPATYNAACTAGGVDNLLPVRYSQKPYSFYRTLTDGFNLQVKIDLNGKFTGNGKVFGTNEKSTGSAKNDAYVWARENYLRTGKTNPTMMAQHLDAWTSDHMWKYGEQAIFYVDIQQAYLPNKDFHFAKKSFFWDLSPWEPNSDPAKDYSAPYDELNQPAGADYKTLKSILELQNKLAGDNIISVGGYAPWFVPKYSSANGVRMSFPDAVSLEWRYSDLFGWYNMGTHGDAYGMPGQGPFANASVFMHIQQKDKYVQPGDKNRQYLPENQQLEDINYVTIYMGDYDSAGWTSQAMVKNYFQDPRRGEIPLCWAVIPQVNERAPHVYNRMYDQATDNDYFVGGDVGYIYGNPESLSDPNRPLNSDGSKLNGTLKSYEKRTAEEFKKYDLDIMGFLLTTSKLSKELEDAYARIAPKGIMAIFPRSENNLVDVNETPSDYDDDVPITFLQGVSDPFTSVTALTTEMNRHLPVPEEPTFTAFRCVLQSVSQIIEAVEGIDKSKKVKVVDPYTYFNLQKEQAIRKMAGRN